MRSKSSSKVESIYQAIERKIVAGDWPIGYVLPTETELATEFDCGRNTITKVMTRLAHEQLVERRKRAGTRVINDSTHSAPPQIELDAFAFIYSSDRHEAIWRIVNGFQEAARKSGRRVVALTMGTDYEKEIELVSRLVEFDVKAAAIYPQIPSPDVQLRLSQLLVQSRFPIALAEVNLPGLGHPCTVVDGFHAGYTMTRYLLDQGLTQIGFLANHSWSPSVAERHKGYVWAMEEAGIKPAANHVLLTPEMRPDYDDPLRDPTELSHGYLDNAGGPQAVVCSNDYIARGLIRAAQERGLRIPEDIRVTGIDGFLMQPESEIPLTTYQVPFEEIGASLFRTLDDMLKNISRPELETRIRGKIIVRKSA